MNNTVAIVTFHGIGTPPAGIPADEAPYWIGEAEFTAAITALKSDADALRVGLTVTFDDGNRSDIDIAAPLLKEHGIAALFFPCAGRIGQPGYLDGADLRALRAEGFGIGSHGMDHRPWGTLQGADLRRETHDAREEIEATLGAPVTDAALPFGSYNRRALAAARAAGFARLYSSDPGFSLPGAWFARRFGYRAGRSFDVARMVAQHGPAPQRLKAALKHRIKALR